MSLRVWKSLPMLIKQRRIIKLASKIPKVFMHNNASALILSSDVDSIRQITLNNPRQKNVLSWEALTQLKQRLQDGLSNGDPVVHCIVIKAKGDVFSAGHDLKELTISNKENHLRLFRFCSDVMMSIQQIPIPVIAQVNGHAVAAGCQLVASCDIVIAGESAKFSTPGVNVGLFCSTPGVPLVRSVPKKAAAYMLYTGLPITAEDALRFGLVSKVVPDDILEEETARVAKVIRNKSKAVQILGKQFLSRQSLMPTTDAYKEAAVVMTENLAFLDTQKGIEAFLKNQKPVWSHTNEKTS